MSDREILPGSQSGEQIYKARVRRGDELMHGMSSFIPLGRPASGKQRQGLFEPSASGLSWETPGPARAFERGSSSAPYPEGHLFRALAADNNRSYLGTEGTWKQTEQWPF